MMGIFSNIIDKVAQIPIVNKVFQPGGVVDTITKPVQYFGAIIANPGTAITKGAGAAFEKAKNESFEKQAGKVLLNTGTVAAAVLTGGTAAGRAAATTVGKSLVTKNNQFSLLKTATTGAAVIGGAGILTKTSKPLDVVTSAPGKVFQAGQGLGSLIDDPSLANAEKFLKENKEVSAAAGLGLVLVGGKWVLPSALNYMQEKKTQSLITDLPTDNNIPTPNAAVIPVKESKPIYTEQTPFSPSTAITPATKVQTPTTGVRRPKRKSMRSPASVNQRVNILVQNKNTSTANKNYISRRILV